jgi:hypothetical protein
MEKNYNEMLFWHQFKLLLRAILSAEVNAILLNESVTAKKKSIMLTDSNDEE